MSAQKKIQYEQLQPGYEFPEAVFTVDNSILDKYLRATEENDPVYRENNLVPPTALAAWAMASLSEAMELPAGTIHVSQELEYGEAVFIDETVTTHAAVSGKRSRGKFDLMTIDISVRNRKGDSVLGGKTSFLLPQTE
ncbi:MAG: MaoC family dehydratase N-terminal domain-containing protein [Dehalococcoidia bacterium]